MRTQTRTIRALWLLFATRTSLAAPPSYNATNITGWNAQQLATLPFFKHYLPAALTPANAPSDFHFAARTQSGLVTGSTWNVFSGPDQRGVLLSASGAAIIDSFGDFHWWACCPYRSATFRVTNAFDVNWSGAVVGLANVPGTSQTSGEEPDHHAISFDVLHDKVDLLPDARYGWATCVNNRGEIAGYAWGGGAIQTGFRRSSDGAFTGLNAVPPGYMPQPLWINAQGIVIGMSVPGAWVSEAGSAVAKLATNFGMPLATVFDVNDAGWIVGTSEQWDHTEQYATIWEPGGAGNWVPHDLTESLNTPGILLDRAIALNNDGRIIAVGHSDSEPPVYGTFLLTPTSGASSSCVPDIGEQPQSVTACANATLIVRVVNPNASTSYQWRKDGVPIDAASNASAATANLVISVVGILDAGDYDCVVTNACGSTVSNAAALTICLGDFNCDGMVSEADLGVLLAAWQVDAGGDLDGDGQTGESDLGILLGQWRSICP
ncbi:MAG: hypothetical protein U1D55_13470 [Phycisphaerae bacterium]